MEYKAIITVNDANITIPGSVAEKIRDRIGPLDVTLPFAPTSDGLEMLREFILRGKPMAEFESRTHIDVLTFVSCAKKLGYYHRDILGYCQLPEADKDWATRGGSNVLSELDELIPEMFSERLYFLGNPSPFSWVGNEYCAYLTSQDERRLVRRLSWLQRFPLDSLFANVTPTTIQRLGELRKQRADTFRGVLIQLSECSPQNLVRVPHNSVDIDATKYPVLFENNRVPMGAPVVCGAMEAIDRLDQYTCGVMKAISQHTSFDNIIVAGNGARQCIEPKYRPKTSSDVDIFVFGTTAADRSSAAKGIVEAFERAYPSRVYYAITGYVITVYIVGIRRKFQIVCGYFQTAYDVLNRFDLSHIQVGAVWEGKVARFVMTVQCARALTNYTSEVWNTDQLRVERMMKAVYNGFNVESLNHFIAIGVDVLSSMNSTKACQDALEAFCSYYYPSGGEQSREDMANNIRHIKMDSKATDVYTDAESVVKTMKTDGEFNSVYATKSYSEFNLDTVGLITPKYMGITMVKTISNANRFRTGTLRVMSCAEIEGNLVLRTKVEDPKYVEHLNTIERGLAGHVRFGARNGRFTRGFLNGGVLEIRIPETRIESSRNYGSGIIVDASGQALDPDDAFVEGEEIYVVYSYGISREREDNHNQLTMPCLVPFKVVRLRVETDETRTDPNETRTDPNETVECPRAAAPTSKVSYDDDD